MKEDGSLEWVGSYGWDGYPGGVPKKMGLLTVKNETDYRANILEFLEEHDGYIADKHGWPWPWDNSGTTDYYYIFHEGRVLVSCFDWLVEINDYMKHADSIADEDGDVIERIVVDIAFTLPDMSVIKKVDFGKGSGVMMFSNKEGDE